MEIGPYQYTKHVLGIGSFSKVYLGSHRTRSHLVAVKKIKLKNLPNKDKLHAELEMMARLHHPHIVAVEQLMETGHHWYIVMEYCNAGTFVQLGTYLQSQDDELREALVRLYLLQLRSALHYLHELKITHRDLKPTNILLTGAETWKGVYDDRLRVKLADFGFARQAEPTDLMSTVCGTPIYMSPELLLSHEYTSQSDLWSVRVIVYELLYGIDPFHRPMNLDDLRHRMKTGTIPYHRTEKELSLACFDLLSSLLQKEVSDRLTWEEFFDHPWFKDDGEAESSESDGESEEARNEPKTKADEKPVTESMLVEAEYVILPKSRPINIVQPTTLTDSLKYYVSRSLDKIGDGLWMLSGSPKKFTY